MLNRVHPYDIRGRRNYYSICRKLLQTASVKSLKFNDFCFPEDIINQIIRSDNQILLNVFNNTPSKITYPMIRHLIESKTSVNININALIYDNSMRLIRLILKHQDIFNCNKIEMQELWNIISKHILKAQTRQFLMDHFLQDDIASYQYEYLIRFLSSIGMFSAVLSLIQRFKTNQSFLDITADIILRNMMMCDSTYDFMRSVMLAGLKFVKPDSSNNIAYYQFSYYPYSYQNFDSQLLLLITECDMIHKISDKKTLKIQEWKGLETGLNDNYNSPQFTSIMYQ